MAPKYERPEPCNRPHGYEPVDKQIIWHFAGGSNIKQVAEATGLQCGTVKNRQHKIMQRLEARTRVEMVVKAIELGIIEGRNVHTSEEE